MIDRYHVNKNRNVHTCIHISAYIDDDRECLATALQFHVEDLVDGLVFNDSELPDSLLAEGCLTEDECSTVRRHQDRKDQIRILLSLIKGRDLRVLKGFLKHIAQHNSEIAEKITERMEANKLDGVRGKLCARCKLERQFNVKHVVDSLWAIQVIDDGLYNKIIYSDSPIGAQGALWKKIFQSLNCLDHQSVGLAHAKLLNALSSKNLFTHLAKGIKDMLIRNHGKLTCSCEPKFYLPNRDSFLIPTSGDSYLPDSSSANSDTTSNEIVSRDGTENGGDTGETISRITEEIEEMVEYFMHNRINTAI